MVEPNRLSAPGEAAARRRVEVVFAAVDELTPYATAQAIVPPRDADDRARRLNGLERAADASGRGALLEQARNAARDTLHAKISEALLGTAYGAMAVSTGRVEDRVGTIQAIDDAVAVAVAEDLLEPDDARLLADPGRRLLGLPPLDAGTPGAASGVPATTAWEPSTAEWADADLRTAVDPHQPLPGVHATRLILFGAIALIGIPTAIAAGLTSGQPVLGILGAVAIGAVCWTLATYRRRPDAG